MSPFACRIDTHVGHDNHMKSTILIQTSIIRRQIYFILAVFHFTGIHWSLVALLWLKLLVLWSCDDMPVAFIVGLLDLYE